MSPPPRSLTFVVSTSLLTASLALGGCDESKGEEDKGPVGGSPDKADKGGDEDRVNVGPETPPPEPNIKEVNPGPEPIPEPPPPEPIHVNEGPAIPEPQPVIKTNPGPNDEPSEAIEPKRVNTRPEP